MIFRHLVGGNGERALRALEWQCFEHMRELRKQGLVTVPHSLAVTFHDDRQEMEATFEMIPPATLSAAPASG